MAKDGSLNRTFLVHLPVQISFKYHHWICHHSFLWHLVPYMHHPLRHELLLISLNLFPLTLNLVLDPEKKTAAIHLINSLMILYSSDGNSQPPIVRGKSLNLSSHS